MMARDYRRRHPGEADRGRQLPRPAAAPLQIGVDGVRLLVLACFLLLVGPVVAMAEGNSLVADGTCLASRYARTSLSPSRGMARLRASASHGLDRAE